MTQTYRETSSMYIDINFIVLYILCILYCILAIAFC